MGRDDRRLLYAILGIVLALLINTIVAAAPECAPAPQVQSAEKGQSGEHGQSVPGGIAVLYQPFCATGSFVVAHKDVIGGLSTFIIAAFTVVLAWSTIRLWRETERLAVGGERQNAAINRPFVFVQSSTPFPVNDEFGNIVRRDIIHHWLNSGNIPGLRVQTHVSWQSFAALPGADFNYPDIGQEDTTELFIGPKATFNSASLQIPENVVIAVAEGGVRLLTWGWVEYSDYLIGSARHRTEFCYEITVRPLPDGQQAFLSFQFWGRHNGADEGCMKPAHT